MRPYTLKKNYNNDKKIDDYNNDDNDNDHFLDLERSNRNKSFHFQYI